jgi:hypothetical protein
MFQKIFSRHFNYRHVLRSFILYHIFIWKKIPTTKYLFLFHFIILFCADLIQFVILSYKAKSSKHFNLRIDKKNL